MHRAVVLCTVQVWGHGFHALESSATQKGSEALV